MRISAYFRFQWRLLLRATLLTVATPIVALAQPCPETEYRLNSQADVNAFPIGCTTVSSHLIINGADITGLSLVSGLSDVAEILDISSNSALTNLDGLSGLTFLDSALVPSGYLEPSLAVPMPTDDPPKIGMFFSIGFARLATKDIPGEPELPTELNMPGGALGVFLFSGRTLIEIDIYLWLGKSEFVREAPLVSGGTTTISERHVKYIILPRIRQRVVPNVYASVGYGLFSEEDSRSSSVNVINPPSSSSAVYSMWSIGLDIDLPIGFMGGIQWLHVNEEPWDAKGSSPAGWTGFIVQLTLSPW